MQMNMNIKDQFADNQENTRFCLKSFPSFFLLFTSLNKFLED